ncbi:hypothetical protein IEQ34_017781 [Dendrobium chrysotoxum]|uniref:G-patch domain-containing protein n=1 Tax=Dendrobium chrysotoxum TaxID=161865 RepID=A0AAV7GCD1_DENCH|nr:hypothetical protein IEQ34_017781 [Dendrobium chrysotoxum]
MGGGNGGRRRSGKGIPTNGGASSRRKPVISGDLSSFVHQGSTTKAGRSTKESPFHGNAFIYTYPEVTATTGVGDETVVAAFVNRDSYPDQLVDAPSYEYDASIVGGVGLGYRGQGEGEEEEEEDAVVVKFEGDEMDCLDSYSTPVIKKDRFLMIGGVRVYTEDSSSSDEGEDGLDYDGKSSDSGARRISDSGESNSSDTEEEDADSSDGSSDVDSDSDIDEELAEDYLEGIGGSSELLNAQWLTEVNLDETDKDGSIRSDGRAKGGGVKLGANALMSASKEYGMKKPSSRKGKGNVRPRQFGSPVVDIDVSGLEDLLFVKDSRTASGKRKKRQPPHLSRSWPAESQKSRKFDKLPGGKKKHRKELIAMKRRQRMINRGKLREMVINDIDMFSFQPMHSRDCSQVQRLASIYALRSGCQGSGKKRFVTVTRTERTCLPFSRDKDRLDKKYTSFTSNVISRAKCQNNKFSLHWFQFLLVGTVDEDFAVCSGNVVKERTKAERRFSSASGSKPRSETLQCAPSKPAKGNNGSGKKKQTARVSFAEKPVSFVSCGIMQVDSAAEMIPLNSPESNPLVEVAETSSSKLGAFEMHTKGFGSRMLAKMGFIEGNGLGKSGQGMVHPIEPIKRPKSLGLGVEFAESATDEVRVEQTGGIGAFEKHTKGFGSRMMVKMGFIPGSGLGKDAQGMTTPLTAVRRPKSRGLGAT